MTNDTLTKAQFLADGVEQEDCSICREQYGPNHLPVRIRSCDHVFGRPCLENWTNQRGGNTCPHCRRKLFRRTRARPDHEAFLELAHETRERAERAMHRDQERRWNSLVAQTEESGTLGSAYNGWINFFDGVIILVTVYQGVKYLWQWFERLLDYILSCPTDTTAQLSRWRFWKGCSWNCKVSNRNHTFCATIFVVTAIFAISFVRIVLGVLRQCQFRRQSMASQVVDEGIQPQPRGDTPRDSPAFSDDASASYSEQTPDPYPENLPALRMEDFRRPALRMGGLQPPFQRLPSSPRNHRENPFQNPALRTENLQPPFQRLPTSPGYHPETPSYLDSPDYSDPPFDPNHRIIVAIETDDALASSQDDSLASSRDDSLASCWEDSQVSYSDDSLPYTSDSLLSSYSDDFSEFLSEYTLDSTSEFEDYW